MDQVVSGLLDVDLWPMCEGQYLVHTRKSSQLQCLPLAPLGLDDAILRDVEG